MNVEKINDIKVYTPENFEDLYELTHILTNVTKNVIINCKSVIVLPSYFISASIVKKQYVILTHMSYVSKKIVKVVGAEQSICIKDDVISAIKYIEQKV